MPKLPRLTAANAEAMLLKAGFAWFGPRAVIGSMQTADAEWWFPSMATRTLHPKILKQVIDAIAETSIRAMPPQ